MSLPALIQSAEEDVKNRATNLCMLLTMLLSFALLHAQTGAKKTARTAPRPKNEEAIIHEIQELEQTLRVAFVDGKSAWWERHLDEHYSGMNPDGQVVRKTDLIQLYGADVKYEEVNLSDMSARIYDDCVIASSKTAIKGSYKGQDFSGDYYFVHVWIKEGEDWKLANSQATKLPGPS